MLSKDQAQTLMQKGFPQRTIAFATEQDNLFIFRAIEPEDSDESGYDDLYSIDRQTSQVKEFSVFDIKDF